MPDVGHKSKVLIDSLTALSLAVVSRAHSDERLAKDSFDVYGSALLELQVALASPTTRSSMQTLAAAMAISTYEVILVEVARN
jgi:hypothetical protein